MDAKRSFGGQNSLRSLSSMVYILDRAIQFKRQDNAMNYDGVQVTTAALTPAGQAYG